MKRLTRLAAFLAFLTGLTHHYQISSMVRAPLMYVRGLTGGLSPVFAAAGLLSSLIAKGPFTLFTGLIGALLNINYIYRVMTPHREFERYYGDGWDAQIPVERKSRMLHRRWAGTLPRTPDPRWRRDVVYWTLDTDYALRCDVWQPPANIKPSGLALLYFHGGGWQFNDKDLGTRPMFRQLIAQGHVVMDVAYRLAPEVQYEAMVGDVKRAIVWMKAHARSYNVDPDKIILCGGSAGGHLALLAAYTPNHPTLDPDDVKSYDVSDTSVCGVISLYGPPDLRAFHDYEKPNIAQLQHQDQTIKSLLRTLDIEVGERALFSPPGMVVRLIGGTPDEQPGRCAEASPITHVGPHCPPTLLIQGGYDVLVKAPPVRRLHNALLAAGVQTMYVELAKAEHGFDVFLPQISPPAQAAFYDIERFLAMMVLKDTPLNQQVQKYREQRVEA